MRYFSHEIRTPLNASYLGLQYLYDHAKQNSDHKQAAVIKELRESNNSVLQILNDLATYVKLDEGIVSLSKTPVYIINTLNDVLRSFSIKVSPIMTNGEDDMYFNWSFFFILNVIVTLHIIFIYM